MSKEHLFIPDGETRAAYIKAEPGRYPACRFTYRRATAKSLLPAANKIFDDEEKAIENTADLVASRIIGMAGVNPETHASEPIEGAITGERLLSMDPFQFTKLMHIVKGLVASDPDPSDGSKNETAEDDAKN